MKLSDICARCGTWGVQAAEPTPRSAAPHLPFTVVKADIKPEARYGFIEREDTRSLKGRSLGRDDLIMHLASGVVARVVERVSETKARIEAWTPPSDETGLRNWERDIGKGVWVCWGRCYSDGRIPRHLVPSDVVLSTDACFEEAIADVYPELMDAARAGRGTDPKSIPDISKLKRKTRRKIMRRYRKLLGKLAKARDWDNDQLAAEIEKGAYFRRTTPDGAEITKWVPPADE